MTDFLISEAVLSPKGSIWTQLSLLPGVWLADGWLPRHQPSGGCTEDVVSSSPRLSHQRLVSIFKWILKLLRVE